MAKIVYEYDCVKCGAHFSISRQAVLLRKSEESTGICQRCWAKIRKGTVKDRAENPANPVKRCPKCGNRTANRYMCSRCWTDYGKLCEFTDFSGGKICSGWK